LLLFRYGINNVTYIAIVYLTYRLIRAGWTPILSSAPTLKISSRHSSIYSYKQILWEVSDYGNEARL